MLISNSKAEAFRNTSPMATREQNGNTPQPAIPGSSSPHDSNVEALLMASLAEEKERLIASLKDAKDIKRREYEVTNEFSALKVINGTKTDKFNTMVNKIVIRWEIPEDVRDQAKDAILEGIGSTLNKEVVVRFNYSAAESEFDSFTYVSFATLQREGVIDLSYVVYHVQFKLFPVVTEREKEKKYLYWRPYTEKWQERTYKPTGKEYDYMRSHFLRQAIDRFSRNHPGSNEPETS